MRHIREFLRLKWRLKRSHCETARSLGISPGAVASVISRATAIGLTWDALEGAANRDMRVEAAAARFRPDLLYRIGRHSHPDSGASRASGRHRHAVTALLAISGGCVECIAVLSHALLAELTRYHWPGNVRELQNVVAALAVAAPARGLVRPSLLPPAMTGAASVTSRRLSEEPHSSSAAASRSPSRAPRAIARAPRRSSACRVRDC
jgi:transcriptional regulator of acetoin/glycerol metabolism